MNLRDIEEAGQRFYAVKGLRNGEQRDGDDGLGLYCSGCFDGCDECDPEVPPAREDVIFDTDLAPEDREGPEDKIMSQDDHDQAERMYNSER